MPFLKYANILFERALFQLKPLCQLLITTPLSKTKSFLFDKVKIAEVEGTAWSASHETLNINSI